MDLSFFLEPPERTVKGYLVIEALAPLSMSTAQPGAYYHSRSAPSEYMLYGLLENALGWHFPEDVRREIFKKARKVAKKRLGRGHELKKTPWIDGSEDDASAAGFESLLQHHFKFSGTSYEPPVERFDDYWTRHVHGRGTSVPGGSRNNDYRIESIANMAKRDEISFGDSKTYQIRDPEQLSEVVEGDKVHMNAIRPHYPMHYGSPTKREYVVPERPYRFRAETTPTVSEMISEALKDPAAPLYLGTSEGWVHAEWKTND